MHKRNVRAIALVAGLALVAVACGDDSGSKSTTTAAAETTAAPQTTAAAETTAAMTSNGELEGFKGTTPMVALSDDFKARLATTPTGKAGLKDYNYSAETYDAITIIALAAEKAGTDGIDMAKEINGITRDGTKCTSFTDCLKIIKDGGDPDYDGVSGNITMNGNGEPMEASYGVLTFGANNRIDDTKTTYVPAAAAPEAEVPQVPVDGTRAGDGVLHIGTLLPQTGSLAFLGPPEFAGAELAIADINAAGGVLGKDVQFSPKDSGDTSTDTASQSADALLADNVDAIIGAASSSVTLTVIDKITAAGVVMFSPANTSNKLSDYPDHGLYFRVAPPDVLQGNLVGQLVAGDGNTSAYILALDDAYGTSLADVVEATLKSAGVEVLGKKIYDPKATSFDAEVDEIKTANPDAIVLITFDEGSRILRTMVEKGIGPKVKKVYGVDGNTGNALGENFDGGK